MANEVTLSKMPGASLAIVGKQFLRTALQQAFERVGGVDAIVDWVEPEIKVIDPVTGVETVTRKRNNENFGALLSLMTRMEPKEVNVRDDRGIENTIDAIEAKILGPVADDGSD